MFAQIARRVAGIGRQPQPLLKTRIGPLILLLCSVLFAPGCRTDAPPSPAVGPDPSDPRAPVSRSTYRSTLGSYTNQRPVEPAPWREQSQGVAPAPKQ
jgi:hypothetical protein